MVISSINIGYWNTNKLISKHCNKLHDKYFIDSIEKCDIIGLSETKCDPSLIHVDNYIVSHFSRKKSKNHKQEYGGLAILVNKKVRKGVKFLNNTCSEYQWLKLDQTFFGLRDNLFVCFVYIPPSNSTFYNDKSVDILSSLNDDISIYKDKGQIMLFGDFNARTGNLLDFVSYDDNDEYVPLSDDYECDKIKNVRSSKDFKVCTRGKELLELCISSRMRILNGRTFGDFSGSFTSFQYNGNSVIDYSMASEEFLQNILYFHVDNPILRLSDHSKISARLICDVKYTINNKPLQDFPLKFKWESVSSELFLNSLKNNEACSLIKQMNEMKIESESDVYEAVNRLENILITAANKSLKRRTAPKRKSKRPNPWFDLELGKMRKELDYKNYLLCTYPNDPIVRGNFFKFRKLYSKKCKLKYRNFKIDLIKKLDDLFEKDPSKYWDLLNKLKGGKAIDSGEDIIPAEEWVDHFKQLNTVSSKFDSRISEIRELLCSFEKTISFCELDYKISSLEISKSIRSLKNGKSTGLDCISNEMIKCGECVLLPCLVKLFNGILCSGFYPKQWKAGYICPIFKTGVKSDPSDYRGIAIISCIGKLFNSVLTNRLDNYLEKHKIISETQVGFQKRARTSDHMFILRTLIEKYTSKKAFLYTCFIDFKKAFDSVIHEALMLKLQNIGIGGPFYRVIKNMYMENTLRIRVKDKITDSFETNIGVRQGDNLSPDLFKIFINDLPNTFNEDCSPVEIGNIKLNCLLYADDVVLLSDTKSGLDNCLSRLEDFCNMWCIDVNLRKTKVVIFNKSGKLLNYVFKFKGEIIENVQSFKYLGIVFSSSGSFSNAKKDLYQRALKAFFKLKGSFGDFTPKIESSLHIYDHTIKPILLYAAEIWGSCTFGSKTTRNSDNFEIEKKYAKYECENLCLKFYKYILGVHSKSSNNAVYGELGRTPLHIEIICTILKFYQRVKDLENCHLMKQTLQESILMHQTGVKTWYSNIVMLLHKLNIDIDNFDILYVKNLLISRFMTYWKDEVKYNAITKEGKLRTYYKFKNIFKKELYLDNVSNFEHRRNLTQLRISAHKLAIEKDRYKNINKEKRICKYCSLNAVEDEMHFLLECTSYQKERKELLDIVSKQCKNFELLSTENKFIWLLSNESADINKALAYFTHKCFEIRKGLLPVTNI